MSLRIKLLSLIVICATGFVVFFLVARSTINTAKINGEWYGRIVQEKDLVADILPPPEYIIESYLVVYQMLEETDSTRLNELASKSDSLRKEYMDRHAFWANCLQDGELKDELVTASFKPALEFFNIRDTEVVPAILGNNRAKAREIVLSSLKPRYEEHRKIIDKVVKIANSNLEKDEATVKKIVENRVTLLAVLGFAVLGVIVICGIYTNYMSSFIIGGIARVVNGLVDGNEQLSSASSQLTTGSQQLAEGTSQQAAALEETSSSLEEIASMTRRNAENAVQANDLMRNAGNVVAEANDSMSRLTTSMTEISRASEETQKIIKTIDEIAFQTNLLALNAAVEAARAGEAGAGFAVVADEVRNLAMRAADAARSTANLIETTVKKVKDGSGLVSKTNEAFVRIVHSASDAAELVAEIAAASKEQSQGIEQVSKAVSEMDKVVQQNASNAEENAAASEEMNAQAAQMRVFVEDLSNIIGSNGKNANKGNKGRMETDAGRTKAPSAGVRTFTSLPSPAGSLHVSSKGKGNGNGKELVSSKRVEKRTDRLLPLDESELRDF